MGQGRAGIERARRDVAEGRPWAARRRLGSYLGAHPADQEARDLLGEVHHGMGDLPAAGAAWFLTARDDAVAREAIALLRDEHRRSLNGLLGAIDARLAVDDPAWPEPVRERLRELDHEARAAGIGWQPGARRARRPPGTTAVEIPAAGWRGRLAVGLMLGILALVTGLMLLGVGVAVVWLAGLL